MHCKALKETANYLDKLTCQYFAWITVHERIHTVQSGMTWTVKPVVSIHFHWASVRRNLLQSNVFCTLFWQPATNSQYNIACNHRFVKNLLVKTEDIAQIRILANSIYIHCWQTLDNSNAKHFLLWNISEWAPKEFYCL